MLAIDSGMLRSLVAYFPDRPVWARSSLCLVQYAWWWVLYYESIRPVVDSWYRVEHTSPCEVARLGGFHGGSGLPAAARAAMQVQKACHDGGMRYDSRNGTITSTSNGVPSAVGAPGAEIAHGSVGRHNKDGFVLDWSMLERVGGAELKARLHKLAREFGYEQR